jgi:two-component system, cell cycle response regulator
MNLTINQWIEKGKDLPVFSGSIANILSLTDGVTSNVSQVADVIKKDTSLSAAILRITNSSAFGLVGNVTTIDQAVLFLGFTSVRNIALGVGVLNLFPPHDKVFLSKTWQRSLVTGLAARELCGLIGNKRKEDAFTIGLLLDIGLIAFYCYDKQKALDLLEEAEKNGSIKFDIEKKYMGIDHVEAGMLLGRRWRLPEDIIMTMKHHHLEIEKDALTSGDEGLTHVAYLASLVGDIFYLGKKKDSITKFTEGCERLFGISSHDSDRLLQNIHPQLTEIATYFDIAIGSGNTYEEVLDKANEEMINIAVSNEVIKQRLTQAVEFEKARSIELEEANRNLRILASKDALTGLFNRQFLNELLEKEWLRAQRQSKPLSVVMADIDDFKCVNDSCGHQTGDVVLTTIAGALTDNLRKNDYLARYGGEEFLFVLPETNMDAARIAAERFKTAVRSLKISVDNDKVLTLSISCGVSTAYPEKSAEKLDALIQRADQALYEAKGSGKDQVVFKHA